MHPERTPDPQALRWVVGVGQVPFVGVVQSTPGPLGDLKAQGVITEIMTQVDAVVIALADQFTWRALGPQVRAALYEALECTAAWEPVADHYAPADADEAIRCAAQALIEGPIGNITKLHGGAFALEDVTQGVVRVRMEGACNGCSISALTLQARFGRELRRACPWVKEIVAK